MMRIDMLIDADVMLARLEECNTSDSTDKALYNFILHRILEQPTIEPEPQSRMVYGYPLEYLVAFAEACRKAGIEEGDLKTFANNCTFAYATMAEEFRQQVNHVIDAFMGNAGGTNESD